MCLNLLLFLSLFPPLEHAYSWAGAMACSFRILGPSTDPGIYLAVSNLFTKLNLLDILNALFPSLLHYVEVVVLKLKREASDGIF